MMQILAGVWNFLLFRKVAIVMRTTHLPTSVFRRVFFHWVQVAGMWSCTSTPPYASMACTGTPLCSALRIVFNGQCLISIGGKQCALCHDVWFGSGSQQAFCAMDMGAISITVKWPGCEPDGPPFSAKVQA
jgi:hypothetical protein